MSECICHHFGKYAATEIAVPDLVLGKRSLDVVGYDKHKKVLKVVECKFGRGLSVVEDAFLQLDKYRFQIKRNAYAFFNAFTKKKPMRFGRQMEATAGGKRIVIEFYVGLMNGACADAEQIKALHSMKERYPDTGIIRVKAEGTIKDHINVDGKDGRDLARARQVTFAIAWPPPDEVSTTRASTSTYPHVPGGIGMPNH